MTNLTAFEELRQRGLIEQVSHPDELEALLEHEPVKAYAGFDPTATSLHVGNLLPVMMLAHLQRRGHRPIAVVGGATGMIGDPSGRDSERTLMTPEQVESNCDAIRGQLERYLDFEGTAAATLLNNADWITPIRFVDWLRDVGKYFTINNMIAKESVKTRLENREQGITYTEFSYMLLQAYDFAWLHEHFGCSLQVGGNDQWGNITAGIDLAHKKLKRRVYGATCALMTTATGEKFGKSAGNSVWLDPELTSPYEFYQYWIQTDDRDVARWLRIFTFLPLDEIAALVEAHEAAPHRRDGQRTLAEHATRIVHGDEGLRSALRATDVLFGGTIEGFSDAELHRVFRDVPSSTRARSELGGDGVALVDLVAETLCASKGEARRLMAQGGVSLNNARVDDAERRVTEADLASETSLVLRSGKKKYFVVWYA